MNVPFVDLPIQIKPFEREIREVLESVVFDKADFIMRQDLIDFENAFAEFIGVKHAIGVANGSDALNICVKAFGIGAGDEVITVSHTFVATIAAIVHAGATPVLVDVGSDHNMDITKLDEAINATTKAIIPVHLNGRVCNMEAIMDIAAKYDLKVIEDSAQAIGGMYKGKKAGSFGDFATNSFYPFKILGCFGDGGMITTNDSDLDYRIRCLRDNGQDRQKGEITDWGWNSRLDNLQAAILSVMLKQLPDMITRRREIARLYCDAFKDISDLVIQEAPTDDGDYYDAFQNYVVTTPKRDQFVKYLNENGVGTLISWPVPTHFHPNLKLDSFKLPNTERISREVVSLPMHPALTDEDVAYVTKTVKGFFSN